MTFRIIKTEESIRLDERKNVLDKLVEWREKRQLDPNIFVGDDWDAEWEYIKELQQQKEGV